MTYHNIEMAYILPILKSPINLCTCTYICIVSYIVLYIYPSTIYFNSNWQYYYILHIGIVNKYSGINKRKTVWFTSSKQNSFIIIASIIH